MTGWFITDSRKHLIAGARLGANGCQLYLGSVHIVSFHGNLAGRLSIANKLNNV
jgi:hypothetical protein